MNGSFKKGAIFSLILISMIFGYKGVYAQDLWVDYENEEYGFSIDYPSKWEVSITIENNDLGDGVIEKRFFFSESSDLGVHIDIFPNSSGLSALEWYYTYQEIFMTNGGILQEDLQIGGSPAVYSFDPEDSESVYPRHTVIIDNTDYIYRVEFSDSTQTEFLDLYREMLVSMSFSANRSSETKLFDIDPSMLLPIEIREQSCCGYVDPNPNPYVCHYGNCTWWAKYKRPDTGGQDGATWGNASEWPDRAREEGFVVNGTPGTDALITGGTWINHVAYIENYDGSKAYLSDMDYSDTDCSVDRWYQSSLSGFTYIHKKSDSTPPSSLIFLTGSLGDNGWYTTTVNVLITASDSGTGVDYSQYNLNGTGWITYSGAFTVSRNGSNTVQYRSVDNAGNWEAIKSRTFKLDNTPPLNPTSVNPGCVAINGVWQNTCSAPSFSWSGASDLTSGIAGYQYYWGQSSSGSDILFTTSPSSDLASVGEGVYYFRVRSKDNAGNYSFWKTLFILKYDATSPAGVLQINEGQNETYRTLVTLNPSGSDALSGARWVRFRDQGNTWTEWQQIIDTYWVLPAVTGHNYIVEAEIMDAAGNISSLISDDIYLNIYPNRPSSINYTLQKSTFGMSATNASSSQYQLSGTLSQPSTIGSHETDNYKLSSGFWSWLVNLVTGPEADLSISKSASAGSVYTGQSITYTLEVQNLGPDEAEDITVVDTLPAGAVFYSSAGTGWSCGEVGGEVQCTRTSMAAAASSTITITINAPGTASTMTNHVEISSSTEDSSLLNNSSNAIVEVRNYADLAITKTASIESIEMGGQFSYSIDVQNLGPGMANSLRVVDNLPAGVSFVSASGMGWVCQHDSGVVACDLLSLNAGATTTIIIDVTAPTMAGRFTNLVSVSSATLDQDMANNDASEEVLVLTEADLEISKTTQVSFVKPGSPLTYTITVQNLGEVEATGITVVDELQDGVVLVSITGETGWECVEATRTCVLASLGGGASSSISLTVTSPETEGVIDNLAQVTSELVEENIENNSDTCSVTVRDETAPEHHNFIPIFIH